MLNPTAHKTFARWVVPVVATVVVFSAVAITRATATPYVALYKNPTAGREVALQIAGMHRASVNRNIVFRRTPEGALRMDIYRPRSAPPRKKLPAVLFVHGRTNTSSPKDLGQFVGWGQLAAASGLIGVTFSHRGAWTADDTKAAIAYVRANSSRLGIDQERIAVQVHAEGAPDGVAAALEGSRSYIRAIVVYYGWLESFSTPALSPMHYLRSNPTGIPPMLIAKAGRDYYEINDSIDKFAAAAAAANAPVSVVTYTAGRSSFDTLQHTGRSREIMRATLKFLRDRLVS